MNQEDGLVEIIEPEVKSKLSNTDLLLGIPIEPIKRLQVISHDDFEDFVREWVCGYLKEKYIKVRRPGGAGDKGRDVVAFLTYDDRKNVIWDNYQCKHYNSVLSASDILIELGKLCYYSFKGAYSVPRKYYFVSPKGISTKLAELIDDSEELKKQLILKWNKNCRSKIISGENIELVGELLFYVENFDFSIISDIDPQVLIEQHSETRYFFYRFGGIQKNRPEPVKPPMNINDNEMLYIRKLLKAYSDHHKSNIDEINKLKNHTEYYNHFNRQRKSFYSADSLMMFERDTLPPGLNAINDLKEEVLDGIIDTVESEFDDGFKRVKEVCKVARSLNTPSYPLNSSIKGNDLAGLCHHLANEDEISWVVEEYD